jgi:membrane protein implicated in regulation of membrane protease activity
MEWLGDNLWAGWLALAVALGAAELLSLDLILLMLAVGCIAGAITGVLGAAVILQVLVAGVASIAMLAAVRPNLIKHLHSGPDLQLGHGKVVGREALVTEDISSHQPGRVKLAGEIWSARPYDDTLTIKAGETVEVLAMKGATVFVHPANASLEP